MDLNALKIYTYKLYHYLINGVFVGKFISGGALLTMANERKLE